MYRIAGGKVKAATDLNMGNFRSRLETRIDAALRVLGHRNRVEFRRKGGARVEARMVVNKPERSI